MEVLWIAIVLIIALVFLIFLDYYVEVYIKNGWPKKTIKNIIKRAIEYFKNLRK